MHGGASSTLIFRASAVVAGIVAGLIAPVAARSLVLGAVMAAAILTVTFVGTWGSDRVANGFLVAAFATVPWNDVVALGFLELSDLLLLVGTMLRVPHLVTSHLELPKVFTIGSVGFVVMGMLSAVAQPPGRAGWNQTVDVFLGVIVVPVIIAWWRPGPRVVTRVAAAYLVGCAVSVLAGLGGASGQRSYGLTSHPNALGTCSAIALTLLPFLWKACPATSARAMLAGLGAVNLVGISVSGSRAALVAVLALAIAFPLFARSTSAVLALSIAAVPAMILGAREARDPDSSSALGRLLGGGDADGASEARATGMSEALKSIIDNPVFGNGWLQTWSIHNIYLEVAAAIGVLGLIFFLMCVSSLLAPLLRELGDYRWLSYPALAAALIGLVDPAIGARYIWAPIALALCADRLARATSPSPPPARPAPAASSAPPGRG